MQKTSSSLFLRLFPVVLISLLFAGCQTSSPPNPPERPTSEKFQIGDTVIVRFSGPGSERLEDHQENVKNDGTITLQQVGSVQALGKSPGELQSELQGKFSAFFRTVTVTVEGLQYVYVFGDVNKPGPFPYSGNMTVLRAIATAGDFNSFALKRGVQVTRASGGEPITVNCNRAIADSRLDIPVYPGDQIFVPRKVFW